MNQLTIRGFEKRLERKIRLLADQEGLSLNRAALRLMRRGAELDPHLAVRDTVGDTLDEFIGTWSEADEEELREATCVFEKIDQTLWE